MSNHKSTINHFFQSNTVWIYIVLFLLFSTLSTATVMRVNWSNFSFYSLAFCGIYFPVLLFAFFRNQLAQRLSKWGIRVLWVSCFLGYVLWVYLNRNGIFAFLFPLEGFTNGIQQIEDVYIFRSGFLSTLSISIIGTEICILLSDYAKDLIRQNRLLNRISMDKMLIGIVIILSIWAGLYASVDIVEKDLGRQWYKLIYLFPYYTIQTGIIASMYYFFYYLNKRVLIPTFLKAKGLMYYGFAAIGSVLVFYPIWVYLLSYLPITQDLPLELFRPEQSFLGKDNGAFPVLIILLSAPVLVALQWYEQDNQIVNLQKEKSETELNLLKQQINPHFFFNTLNNLYALSITKDQQTPEVILQLSELMRYVIYKGKEESVPLKEEIKYIEDYIQLQQIRLHKKLDFQFNKTIENGKQPIPPLLFITFVENAFKHGIEPAGKDCFLHLSVSSKNNQVTFSCKNSIEEKLNTPKGIGLTNLKRRLELHFPNQHTLQTEETPTQYHTMLQIDLS